MTSRERVLAALNHRQPDQVPVDLAGHRSSGVSALAYGKLKAALGIQTGGIYVYDVIQQLAIVEAPVLDALGVDTVEMGRGFMLEAADWKPWVLPDGTECLIPACVNAERRGSDWFLLSDDGLDLGVQRQGCLYFEQVHWPRRERPFADDPFDDLEADFPHNQWTGIGAPGTTLPATPDGYAALAAGARALRGSTDRAIIGLFGGNLFEIPQFLYGIDRYLEYMALYPEATLRLSEKLCEMHLARLEPWLGAVGPYIDVVNFGDDLGSQNGPLMSPAMYRRYYKPFHSVLWHRAKELADVKVMLHSCGGFEPLLGDLVEAGLDATNPVQTTCAGMAPRHLKDTFGDRLTLWGGGCDTRHVLPHGTPAEIAAHVREQVDALSPGGGFVFQQVHNILADVPPENVIAMYEALR
jgi:uroporphyrinogen decarboxylase